MPASSGVLMGMGETITEPVQRVVMPAKVVRLRARAAREVAVTVVALLREVPREVAEILRPRHETSALPIVWIIAPLNIVPCEMNTEPCKIKYVPKWVCLLMEVAGVALRVVVAVNPNKVAVVVPGAKNNTKYQASTIVDSAGFFYLQCL